MAEKKRIFISWSGDFGREIADFLQENLFQYADLDPWISQNIDAGASWFEETKKALNESHYGVACLTPGASSKPWINFETGFLFGKLNNCKLITFNETLRAPLRELQRMDGNNQEAWVKLLEEMTDRSRVECDSWIKVQFPELQKIVERRNQSPYQYLLELNKINDSIQSQIDSFKKNTFSKENSCFQKVINLSYNELYSQLIEEGTYGVTLSKYPQYLAALQKEFNPIVKAVALVYIEEDFWQQESGKEILRTSNRSNTRVFVFKNEKDFTQMNITLNIHASSYDVYAISLAKLNRKSSLYAKDFSIISTSNGSVLADYETEDTEIVRFTAHQSSIAEHELAFEKIRRNATRIPSGDISESEMKKIKRQIFKANKLADYIEKPIEMSAYIDVENYDLHEENHAYYKEMMSQMIDIFKEYFPSGKGQYRVLEMGAGTGIFTSRINEQTSIQEIVAIEYDWHCYKTLEYKFRDSKEKVKPEHKDSRKFDPPGKFDCVFTSFADHHIKEQDKGIYFDNIKRNLKPGGIVIVGDEFLRDHDSDSNLEREEALKAYHHHIIEKAEEIGDTVLAGLESEALRSGLERIGDFKVSCKTYESLLRDSDFNIKDKKLIGPTEGTENIGGIYVYVFENKNNIED